MKIEVERIELCDLMLACTAAEMLANDDGQKWTRLHSKLKDILEEYDNSKTTND